LIRGREFIGDPILFGYNTITSWANNVELFKKISKPSSFSLFLNFGYTQRESWFGALGIMSELIKFQWD